MANRRKPQRPMGWDRAVFDSGLRGPKQSVLWALKFFVAWGTEDGECWPSVPTIARGAGVCEQTARTCLQELHACGIIERVEASGYADRDSNTYWLSLAELRRRANASDDDDDTPPLSPRGGREPTPPPPHRPPPLHAVDPPPLPDGGESSREQTREPKPPFSPPRGGGKEKARSA